MPHNYIHNSVAYSGTHDNDTTLGWWEKLDAATRLQVTEYFGNVSAEIHWDLIRALFMSVSNTAIVTLQDVLGLGSDARMNFPAALMATGTGDSAGTRSLLKCVRGCSR